MQSSFPLPTLWKQNHPQGIFRDMHLNSNACNGSTLKMESIDWIIIGFGIVDYVQAMVLWQVESTNFIFNRLCADGERDQVGPLSPAKFIFFFKFTL